MAVADLQALLDAAKKEETDLQAKQGELGTAQTERDAAKAAYDTAQAHVNDVSSQAATERSELVASLRALSDHIAQMIDQLSAA